VVALWGVRDYEHRRAVNALEARTYENADPIRASAFPFWWTPLRWVGVVETGNFYATTVVDSNAPEVDPDGAMQILYKPEETPATLAAKRSYLGRVYLDWAQYPITETEPVGSGEQGYLVRFKDLRFQQPGRTGSSVLSATVELDRNLNVVGEYFGMRKGGSD
jgi:inner membrane protein